MNDATEFESSLAGVIDFFQHLRRKLEALETGSGVQHDRLHAIATTVAAIEQDRQQVQQSLATLANDLRTQSDGLRQELNALETRTASADRVGTLEEQFEQRQFQLGQLEQMARTGQEQLEQFAARVETQYQRLLQLETALETHDRNSQSILGTLADLKTEFEQHTRALDTLNRAVESGESARMQLQARQNLVDELTESLNAVRQEMQTQQDRLKHLDILMGKVSADTNSTRQILNVLQTDLTTQSDTLREIDQNWSESFATYQDRLKQLETIISGPGLQIQAMADSSSAPVPGAEGAITQSWETLATQVRALAELQQSTQQQFADLINRFETQRLEFQNASDGIDNLQQEIQRLQQEIPSPNPAFAQPSMPFETGGPDAHQLRQDLDTLQETVTTLITRITGQTLAFDDHLDQFRDLNAYVRELQQHFLKMETLPQQLTDLEQRLTAQRQEFVLLNEIVQQVQADSQRFSESLRPGGQDSRIVELETRLGEQSECLTGLTTSVETIRTETRTNQEKVLTLATNVVKRINDFQNQLTATETSRSERSQEMEQKIAALQATLENLETQYKSRRWFKAPATFSTVVLVAGAAFLAILAR